VVDVMKTDFLQSNKLKDYKIIIAGLIFAGILWFAETLLHLYLFQGPGDRNFIRQMFFPVIHEGWMRILAVFIILAFSLYAQYIFLKRKKAEEKIIEERDRSALYLDLLSHDVYNLNQAIILSSELQLMNKNLEGKFKHYSRNSLENAKAVSGLIKNVINLSKLNDDTLELKDISIPGMLDESIKRLRQIHPDKNIEINKQLTMEDVMVKGNELMESVFDNILNNAVKYNKTEKVKIDISLKPDGYDKYWKLEFKDNGPGIPDEMKKRIFHKLERGDRTIYGSGMGLTIVNEIVKRFGGRTTVEDRIKRDHSNGSNFVILLPRIMIKEKKSNKYNVKVPNKTTSYIKNKSNFSNKINISR
jgi:signal transduction histidine kinase